MTRSGADGTLTALGGQKAKSVERRVKGERLDFAPLDDQDLSYRVSASAIEMRKQSRGRKLIG
jgi:hypothetical protein